MRLLRVGLPLGVVLTALVAGAFIYLEPLGLAANLPFELGRVSLRGSRVVMDLPKLSGFTADNRGYNVSAISASQDLTNPDQIDLSEINARLEMADKGWARLQSRAGQYNTKSQQMRLSDGVHFDTSTGYGGKLAEAEIDMKAGTMVSRQPVELTYLDGKLTADTLEVSQKDARALLTGHVTLVFRMPPTDQAEREARGLNKPPPEEPLEAADPAEGAAPAPEGTGSGGAAAGAPGSRSDATGTATPRPTPRAALPGDGATAAARPTTLAESGPAADSASPAERMPVTAPLPPQRAP
ncbi:LPS export ABC transporter periplasmic protein LptC [Ancylobacter lacus]|nr:LPS export ABC transporter periplasmic protein LptC [Ancylobacter lacus]